MDNQEDDADGMSIAKELMNMMNDRENSNSVNIIEGGA